MAGELYLYHATDANYKDAILEQGLLINPPNHNWDDMYCEGKVFLAFDAAVAESYAESSDEAPDDIIIFKVPLSCLHENSIGYDWNNKCEYHTDINSCIYELDIPGSCLQICKAINEPFQDIDSFKGTDLYERIMNVFDEEVETNLENEDNW